MKGGDKQTNKQTDERKSPCVLQDFVPFGAAAQKGRKEGRNLRKERTILDTGHDVQGDVKQSREGGMKKLC